LVRLRRGPHLARAWSRPPPPISIKPRATRRRHRSDTERHRRAMLKHVLTPTGTCDHGKRSRMISAHFGRASEKRSRVRSAPRAPGGGDPVFEGIEKNRLKSTEFTFFRSRRQWTLDGPPPARRSRSRRWNESALTRRA
jgi:hypothetical protein